MRRSVRDVAALKQRTLFGVDKLELLVADVAVELLRLRDFVLQMEELPTHVSRETTHVKRLKAHIESVCDLVDSQFELDTEVEHAPPEK